MLCAANAEYRITNYRSKSLVIARYYLFLTLILELLSPTQCYAYIGPGAGFAFLGSGFVLFLTIGLALVTISLWPLQYLWRKFRGLGVSKNARTRRVVIL